MASFASELSTKGQDFFIMVRFQLFGYVAVLLIYSLFLLISLLRLLVNASLNLFLQCGQFGGLFGSESVEGSLYFDVAGIEPCLFLAFFELS